MRTAKKTGAVMVTFAIALTTTLAAVGLAVDGGLLYVARSEAQSYADAAALAAAFKLDGTSSGITAAKAAALGTTWKKWMFNSRTFSSSNVDIRFCTTLQCDGNGAVSPSGVGIRSVWVRASAGVPIHFMTVAGFGATQGVSAAAVAAQASLVSANEGLFPFVVSARGASPTYGFETNLAYTFRWHVHASDQLLGAVWAAGQQTSLSTQQYVENALVADQWCPGDARWIFVSKVLDALGLTVEQIQSASGQQLNDLQKQFKNLFQDKGFYLVGSQSEMKAGIEFGYQTQTVTIGDILNAANGMKTGMADSIIARVNRDANQDVYSNGQIAGGNVTAYYTPRSTYLTGSGDRLVVLPVLGIQSLVNGIGTPVVDFLPFLLLTDGTGSKNKNDYYDGAATPHKPWCMAYMGATVAPSGTPGYTDGVFYIRLMR